MILKQLVQQRRGLRSRRHGQQHRQCETAGRANAHFSRHRLRCDSLRRFEIAQVAVKFDSAGRRHLLALVSASSRVDVVASLKMIGVRTTPQWIGKIVAGDGEPDLRLAIALQRRCRIPLESWERVQNETNVSRSGSTMVIEADVADRAAE